MLKTSQSRGFPDVVFKAKPKSLNSSLARTDLRTDLIGRRYDKSHIVWDNHYACQLWVCNKHELNFPFKRDALQRWRRHLDWRLRTVLKWLLPATCGIFELAQLTIKLQNQSKESSIILGLECHVCSAVGTSVCPAPWFTRLLAQWMNAALASHQHKWLTLYPTRPLRRHNKNQIVCKWCFQPLPRNLVACRPTVVALSGNRMPCSVAASSWTTSWSTGVRNLRRAQARGVSVGMAIAPTKAYENNIIHPDFSQLAKQHSR